MRRAGSAVRALLIAEACNPDWESVPLVGFNLYCALRQIADVTLVTQVRNRGALLRQAGNRDHIVFINSERLASPFSKIGEALTLGRGVGWTTKLALGWLPYLYFEYLVYRRFCDALKRGEYDLIHRITPLTPVYPSPLACWTDVPFVLGPLNGGLPWPAGMERVRLAEMEFLSYVREFYRLLPYHRSTFSRAACVIAGSRYTLSQIPAVARSRATYLPENGIDPTRFSADGRTPPSQVRPFRILFVGRLVPYKQADVVVDAFATSRLLRTEAELVIVGDGPQRPALEARARALGVAGTVSFSGRVPQKQVATLFRNASVFVFPSIREFGGAVVIEAMACGLPAIVVDYGGPGEHVTPATGIAVPLVGRGQLVERVRSALERLLLDGRQLDRMSSACVQRIAERYTWARKAERVCELYHSVLANRPRAC